MTMPARVERSMTSLRSANSVEMINPGRDEDHLALAGPGTEAPERVVNVLVGIVGGAVAACQNPGGCGPRHGHGLRDF
jgi:hypothetical protein